VKKTKFFCPQYFESMTKLFFVVILGQSKDVIYIFDVFLSCFCYQNLTKHVPLYLANMGMIRYKKYQGAYNDTRG
jgi:hypothetical protein